MSAGVAMGERLEAARRGWCPGALRPMASGDGLIVRVRVIGGALRPRAARAIASAASCFGNGHIDLTSRANLQMRGVSERSLPALQAALDGLGLFDADADAEAVRNIVASPLAGLDPAALLDIRPCVAALDQRLRRDRALWRLPGKFGFAIDDGGRFSVADESADIGFVAVRRAGAVVFAVRLAGRSAGFCAVDDLADQAAALAAAFLALRGSGGAAARRMAALLARIGVAPIVRAAGLDQDQDGDADRGASAPKPGLLGPHDLGPLRALGAGAAFGRLKAAQLTALAEAAEWAQGELRLTPWRAVLIIGPAIDATVASRLRQAGLLLEDNHSIRAVAACPGAPACVNGSTATQNDAERLAPLARRLGPRGVALHVSGCAKGCAHAAAAPVTLVGRSGRYDLVLDGRADEEPALRGLAPEALGALFEALAGAPPAGRAAALNALARTKT